MQPSALCGWSARSYNCVGSLRASRLVSDWTTNARRIGADAVIGSANPVACQLLQIVPENHPALHHKFDSFHLGDVRERVYKDGNNVGEPAFFHVADLVSKIVVQALGGNARGRLQSLRRGHSPFHINGELIGLHAVSNGVRAAAEDLLHAGGY